MFQVTHISPVSDADESANFEDYPVQSGFVQGLRDNVGSKFTIVSLKYSINIAFTTSGN